MIPAFDYRPGLAGMRDEIDAAISRVLDSGRLILGPEVEAFEREFAAFLELPHAVGVASGTDALILALRAAGVGDGDEVLTVANAGAPPVAAIRAIGATPRFADVREDSLLLDAERAESALTPVTRAIVAVHLYGQPVELDALRALADRRNITLIEDCAQAHGASVGGRPVGGIGDFGCFSFYPTKNLGAFGDGGAVVTRDGEADARLRELRMYGFRGDQVAHVEGLNSRLDELQAAILRVRLRHLPAATLRRREIARLYDDGLADVDVLTPVVGPEREHVYHLYVIRSDDRRSLIRSLADAEIGFGIHYPEPVHLMAGYRFLGLSSGDLPVSERASETVLSLPVYPGLADDSVGRVIEAVTAAGGRSRG